MSPTTARRFINLGAFVSLSVCLGLTVYWYQLGVFHDLPSLQAYLTTTGLVGPLIFIGIQIIQVVIPIIPGGISTAAGVLLFGPWAGFAYNYIGISIGSCLNFFLARHYGKPFILFIISEATYDKYIAKTTNQHRFNWLFAAAIIAPVAPDDVLCLIAGLTKMKFSTFFWIIVLGKPVTIAAYSYALIVGAQWLLQFF
ncbi:TVP38/TMEM64 family protein [Lacticaseibacillus daqingensis]|uniref:TVP38/TMEM64 family protein n=1 Tax=Lacticaseibacillus daqingensis TaxID=2486014 RepID=UPI000F781FBC|nr:VTT domain-containing protein [Lacticaseibacillus daqingensis]